MKKGLRIRYNAPVTISFSLLCAAVYLLGVLTRGGSDRLLFSVYRASWLDPLSYLRVFLHVLGHGSVQHLVGNLMYILLLGPMLEEKYGSRTLLAVMAATALITGVVELAFFPGARMYGASGIVFAFILLASLTGVREGEIPLTFLLVAALYIGQQVVQMASGTENVAYIAHFVGGAVGTASGFLLGEDSRKTDHRF